MAAHHFLSVLAGCLLLARDAHGEDRRLLSGRGGEYFTRRLASNNKKSCNGRFECSWMTGGMNGGSVCAYGHTAENGNCDNPCEGIRREPCKCIEQKDAEDGQKGKAQTGIIISLIIIAVGILLAVLSVRKRQKMLSSLDGSSVSPISDPDQQQSAGPAAVEVVTGTVVGVASQGPPVVEASVAGAPVPEETNEALMNDDGAVVSLGNDRWASIIGMDGTTKYYCSRDVGYSVLGDESDGTCGKVGGPYGGPQCPSCVRFQEQKATASSSATSGKVFPTPPASPPAQPAQVVDDLPERDQSVNTFVSNNTLVLRSEQTAQLAQDNPTKFNMIRVGIPFFLIAFCLYMIVNALFIADEPFYDDYFSFIIFIFELSMIGLMVVAVVWRLLKVGPKEICTVRPGENPVRMFMEAMSNFYFFVPFIGVAGLAWGVLKYTNPGGSYHAECGYLNSLGVAPPPAATLAPPGAR